MMKEKQVSASQQLQLEHLPALDGLRGIAIGLILLHHCFGKPFAFCWIGVDLFFVLSGFLITRILLNSRDSKGYLRNFYMRRVLRIFPLYYAVLIVMFIVFPFIISGFKVTHDVLISKQGWYWLYSSNWLNTIQGWLPGKSMVLSHFWSLAIEEQYYLFWPFIILLFPVRKLPWIIIVLIMVSVVLRFSGVFHNPGYYVSTVTRMDGLLLGSLLAWCVVFRRDFLRKWAKIIGLSAGFALLIGLAYTRNPEYSNPFMVGPGYTLLGLFFFFLLTLALQSESIIAKRILCAKPLLWLGKYSYGLYVFHYIVFWELKDTFIVILSSVGGPTVAIKIAASLLSVMITGALALFSYHLLEQPFLRLKRHFTAAT